MNNLKKIGEFGLIERIKEICTDASDSRLCKTIGIGDDCAVLPQSDGMETLVSTDMLVEGTHFLMEDIAPRDLGWKAAAVNFSDIAACGGTPTGSFLSICLPPKIDGEWMDEFIRGYRDMSLEAGAPLLGGDTTSSKDRLCINVTVLGETREGCAKLRSTARPGDLVCVTGTLGDSAAGLRQILEALPRDPALIQRHYRPEPRLQWGKALGASPAVHAMMDISDGIGSDLRHILKASGVGARIDIGKLPLSQNLLLACAENGWDPVELALSGGEDYELLFTLAPESLGKPETPAALSNPAASAPNCPFTVIGEITEGSGIVWEGAGEKDYIGFRHF